MSGVAIQVTVEDHITPTVKDLIARFQDREALHEVAGRAAANVTKKWLHELEGTRPNKLGGRRTHFWAHAAAATGHSVTPDGAIVYTEAEGVLFQRFGGVIKPSGRVSDVTGNPITRLAIPARSEAHGKLPGDFNNLEFWMDDEGHMGLVEADAQEIKIGRQRKDGSRKVKAGKETGGLMMFWLVNQVEGQEHPEVLPPESYVGDSVCMTMLNYLVRKAGRAA